MNGIGRMILHCPVCLAALRAKYNALQAMPHRLGNGRPCKQIALPPVAAWER